ncbi:MAG: hypothetical protein IPG32_16555 [Saprospirales bacterium]|nr:hypothetical protein [Saprospirales bacterium]
MLLTLASLMSTDWILKQPFWLAFALVLLACNSLLFSDLNASVPGTLVLFAGLGATYWLGKKFFGRETLFYFLLVFSASLLLPLVVQKPVGDPWVWLCLVLTVLASLAWLKQPRWYWRLGAWAAFSAALFLQPLEALLTIMPLALFWRFRHPNGRQLDGLYLWIAGPLIAAGVWWWQREQPGGPDFLWSWSSPQWPSLFGIQWLAMLPWLGFLAAGLVEIIRNQSKGEEWSVLMGGIVLGAMSGNTLFLQWAFALIIAKQLQRFFMPGYPYGNLVKTLTLLHLMAWLLLGILGLIYSYSEWGAQGFRTGMILILAYWIPGFFGAIGMYGKDHRLMSLGLAFSALLFSLATRVRSGPWLEKVLNELPF